MEVKMFKMKKFGVWLGVVGALVFGVTACLEDNTAEYKKDAQTKFDMYLTANHITTLPQSSGLYFILKDSSKIAGAKKPTVTDYALVSFSLTLIDEGKVVETDDLTIAKKVNILPSIVVGAPSLFSLSTIGYYIQGLSEGLQLMHEGDSAQLIIPEYLGLGSAASNTIPQYSGLVYHIRLLKVISSPVDYDLQNVQTFLKDSMQMDLKDSTSDGIYIKNITLSTDTALSEISETTNDTVVRDSMKVVLRYRLFLIDGRKLVDSDTLVLTNSISLIPGFVSAVKRLRQGSVAKVVIPYQYGYGAEGKTNSSYQTVIPNYTSLYYYLKVDTTFLDN